MKTAYYTVTTWNEGAMAAGFDSRVDKDRPAAMVRRTEESVRARDEDKVIDLSAWRAANLEELEYEPEWERAELEEEPSPAPRPRRHRRAVFTAELVSTLSVVVVAVVLIVRVLTF